jgi:thiol-disulfide isomerase/thioredoxin
MAAMIALFHKTVRCALSVPVVLALFWAGCMPVVEQAARPVASPGARAAHWPDRTVPSLTDDGTLSLDDYRGQVVLIDFWATWSAPSRSELPQLARLHQGLAGEGFTLVGMCVDRGELDDIRRRVEALDVPYPVGWADEAVMNAYGGVRVAPTKVLLDRAGRIRETYEGVADPGRLRSDIVALLTK